jgi:hypothetical protein
MHDLGLSFQPVCASQLQIDIKNTLDEDLCEEVRALVAFAAVRRCTRSLQSRVPAHLLVVAE